MNKFEIGLIKFKNGLNRAFPNEKKHLFTSCIITAAGSGERMGGVSKQLMPLCSIPCILYSLQTFQNCDEVDEIIIVSKESETEQMEKLCRDNKITKLSAVVCGGDTRQKSVSRGFYAISKKSEIVAIHDAARPLIRPEHISLLLSETKKWGSACAAKKVTDSVKRATESDFISETVERENLFTVQTPQVFKSDIYRVALAFAEQNGYVATDDCALVEKAGFPIKLCDLHFMNVKLTNPEDVFLIESLLKEKKND